MGKENNLGIKPEAKVLDFDASEKIKKEIEELNKLPYDESEVDFNEGKIEGLEIALQFLKEGVEK